MNFRGDYFILVIISILRKITSDELRPFEVCPNAPKNLKTVHATIYFNGCTFNDGILFSRICAWREGFSDNDVLLTFKVGGDVTFKNNKWACMSDQAYDCNCTFQYACLSQLMDWKKLLDLICCAQNKEDPPKGVNKCIAHYQMGQAVADCMNGKTQYDPKKIALANAKEILDAGINVRKAWEPFVFFEQEYDNCTSNQSADWWAQSICKMLTAQKFNKLKNCKEAFSLN